MSAIHESPGGNGDACCGKRSPHKQRGIPGEAQQIARPGAEYEWPDDSGQRDQKCRHPCFPHSINVSSFKAGHEHQDQPLQIVREE